MRSKLYLELGARVEYQCDPDSSIQHSADLKRYLEKPATLKKRAINIAVDLWMCTSDLHKLAKDKRDEIADLRKKLLDSQQTVIELQKQKLQEKSEVVKTGLETYSSGTSQGTASVVSLTASTTQLRKGRGGGTF